MKRPQSERRRLEDDMKCPDVLPGPQSGALCTQWTWQRWLNSFCGVISRVNGDVMNERSLVNTVVEIPVPQEFTSIHMQ